MTNIGRWAKNNTMSKYKKPINKTTLTVCFVAGESEQNMELPSVPREGEYFHDMNQWSWKIIKSDLCAMERIYGKYSCRRREDCVLTFVNKTSPTIRWSRTFTALHSVKVAYRKPPARRLLPRTHGVGFRRLGELRLVQSSER
jgi:hypothetical protein